MPFTINNEIDRLLTLSAIGGFDSQTISQALEDLGCIWNRPEGEREFIWVCHYKDDTFIHQFEDGGVEHHYADIDLEKVKKVSWMATNKTNKFLTLDMETGLVETNLKHGPDIWFMMEDLANPLYGEKKLILFTRKRESTVPGVGGLSHYSYLLGWETSGPGKERRVLVILPTGEVKRLD